MAEPMLWTERIFASTRCRFAGFWSQLLIRSGFILVFWVVGAVLYAADGPLVPYISSVVLYEGLYARASYLPI